MLPSYVHRSHSGGSQRFVRRIRQASLSLPNTKFEARNAKQTLSTNAEKMGIPRSDSLWVWKVQFRTFEFVSCFDFDYRKTDASITTSSVFCSSGWNVSFTRPLFQVSALPFT